MPDLVGRHQLHRAWGEHARSLEGAAQADHLEEARVVARRGQQAGAAREAAAGTIHVVPLTPRAFRRTHDGAVGPVAIQRCEPRPLCRRQEELCVGEPERPGDARPDDGVERLPGDPLHDAAENVGVVAVHPRLAGLRDEGQRGQPVDARAHAVVLVGEVPAEPGGRPETLGFVGRRHARLHPVRDTCRMREQILDCDRPFGGHDRGPTGPVHRDRRGGERRHEAADRIGEPRRPSSISESTATLVKALVWDAIGRSFPWPSAGRLPCRSTPRRARRPAGRHAGPGRRRPTAASHRHTAAAARPRGAAARRRIPHVWRSRPATLRAAAAPVAARSKARQGAEWRHRRSRAGATRWIGLVCFMRRDPIAPVGVGVPPGPSSSARTRRRHRGRSTCASARRCGSCVQRGWS